MVSDSVFTIMMTTKSVHYPVLISVYYERSEAEELKESLEKIFNDSSFEIIEMTLEDLQKYLDSH